ncbi:Phage integrase family protein [Devosia sp. YR412]|uniref:tyrosine-type recombinase/integrase n=1 Tax=Devosia sp. YR412 TaxID=1881030 RepID=UPI0008B3833C|nr:site-specific integrase [Devosia sp. YR412]SEP82335.1 Phage integrase family protein [Devosia sp. YR412]
MTTMRLSKHDLSADDVLAGLAVRYGPYYQPIAKTRHLGYRKGLKGDEWYARIRTRAGGYYRRRLGWAVSPARPAGLTYETALAAAHQWFDSSTVLPWAAEPSPLGVKQDLIVCPIEGSYSVAHAMHEYVEWKRLVAAQSHFETCISLINYHIIPRLANLAVDEFNSEHLRHFVRDVLETPVKRGRRALGPQLSIASLDDEQLRKRKKTVNTLIGILRVAFQISWESGKVESERAWRCLRRLPAVDRPRSLHLSRAECRDLIAQCRPDLERLVLGALYTGCRSNELLNMRCEDVGRDGYGVYIPRAKNYRARFIFLPDEGMAWFLDLVRGRKRKDFVFVRESGKPWIGNQKSLFKNAVRAAELPDEFTFHGLRHTYASQLVQAGATVYAVAAQLGHADPTTVLRTYGHLAPQIRESEVRQRFTPVSPENDEAARGRSDELRDWRANLHGGVWREYAKISDVWDPARSLEPARLPNPIAPYRS